jgi:hypothetical protein
VIRTSPQAEQRAVRGRQPRKRSASSIWHFGVKPQPSSSRSSPCPATLVQRKGRDRVRNIIANTDVTQTMDAKQGSCMAKLVTLTAPHHTRHGVQTKQASQPPQRETHLTYLEASRPRRSDRMAGDVPSMGSQRRLMGGRICVARYHS